MPVPIETYVARALQWRATEQGPGPQRITLFPTNICNIQCRHCWQRWGEYDKTYKSEVSDERLLALVDEAAALGVEDWYFVGGGEPMARGKLVMAMAERIRALGMNGHIHTNGTLFRPGMLERLVEIGWQAIRVSLDGPNAEINDYIRTAGFEKATGNIRRLSELKREKGVDVPELALYATVNTLIYDKVVDFVELAHSLGPDVEMHLSGLIVQSEGSAELELKPDQLKDFPNQVRRGLERALELGVVTNFDQYLKDELVLDTMVMNMNTVDHTPIQPDGTFKNTLCMEPILSASITPDGKLGPCCAFYAEDALSIKDYSLIDVWYGSYMRRVRQGMLHGNPPDYCLRCPSNLYVHKEHVRAAVREKLDWTLKADAWGEMGATARLVYLTNRTAKSLKEAGVKGTLNRSKNWLRLRKTSKAN